jgi:hypothetical protein
VSDTQFICAGNDSHGNGPAVYSHSATYVFLDDLAPLQLRRNGGGSKNGIPFAHWQYRAERMNLPPFIIPFDGFPFVLDRRALALYGELERLQTLRVDNQNLFLHVVLYCIYLEIVGSFLFFFFALLVWI